MNLLTFFFLIATPLYALARKDVNPSELAMGPLVRYNAPEKPTASIILLHGFSGTSDVYSLFPQTYHQQERFKHINFIFPNAPLRGSPPTNDSVAGSVTQSWFNTSAAGPMQGYDEVEFWQIVDYIHDLVLNETLHGISPQRVIVGGFSQGGVVSLGALAGMHPKIGGWLLFSTASNFTLLKSHLVFDNQKTPVFHGQGLDDPIIAPQSAIDTANSFKSLGFNYHLHFYPGMSHQVDWAPNDRDVEEWVAKTIPEKWHK